MKLQKYFPVHIVRICYNIKVKIHSVDTYATTAMKTDDHYPYIRTMLQWNIGANFYYLQQTPRFEYSIYQEPYPT